MKQDSSNKIDWEKPYLLELAKIEMQAAQGERYINGNECDFVASYQIDDSGNRLVICRHNETGLHYELRTDAAGRISTGEQAIRRKTRVVKLPDYWAVFLVDGDEIHSWQLTTCPELAEDMKRKGMCVRRHPACNHEEELY